ncbi:MULTISPECIES: hypothetical protein [unclassified Bacillus (in: firmicutes)]|nr:MULTISPECIES: hypothetical protein [unclassified Bacillus (in: firmicutes)]
MRKRLLSPQILFKEKSPVKMEQLVKTIALRSKGSVPVNIGVLKEY